MRACNEWFCIYKLDSALKPEEHTHMYQKTIVIGHLGKDPEMRYTPTGVPVTSFSIATTRKWTNQNGEPQEKTTWFRVTCWQKTAELAAQYLKKGRLVLVEGDIDAQAFTDREGNPAGDARAASDQPEVHGRRPRMKVAGWPGGAPGSRRRGLPAPRGRSAVLERHCHRGHSLLRGLGEGIPSNRLCRPCAPRAKIAGHSKPLSSGITQKCRDSG